MDWETPTRTCPDGATCPPVDADADADADTDADADADADTDADADADADTDADTDTDADVDVDADADTDTDADVDADTDADGEADGDGCVPGEEVCNGVDDDCDGEIDEEISMLFFRDADGDGFGDVDAPWFACDSPEGPEGYVANHRDCDDGDANIHPGADDICDGVDNDCSGAPDEGCPCGVVEEQRSCGEGGDTGVCQPGAQHCVDEGGGREWGECAGGVRPEAEECDDRDNDCDGETDEPIPCSADCGDASATCGGAATTRVCRCP